jgi:hypothetical protein
MRPYWKIERTYDTRVDDDGNLMLVREIKGWFGRPPSETESRRLTKQELNDHWDNASDYPTTEEDKFWHSVKALIKLNTEWNGNSYSHHACHRGNIWREAERVGWDADEAWDFYQAQRWPIKQAADAIIKEEGEHLGIKGLPTIHHAQEKIPVDDITHKTQASQRTKIANSFRQHLSKRGKPLPPRKS